MAASEDLRALGRRFADRLPAARLELALGYVDFGEESLALEMLCDHLCGEVVPLSRDEYDDIMRVNKSMNPRLSARMVESLKTLASF